MAAASSNEFQLVVPKEAQTVRAILGAEYTVPCHLSPEISAVAMEIRWFKETDCLCLYKNGQMIEGRSYEHRVNLLTDELERGNVSPSLKDFSLSDVGDYLCQVTKGDRTEEITVRVKEEREERVKGFVLQRVTKAQMRSFGIYRLQVEEMNRTWTEEERLKMEDSAVITELFEKSKNPEDLKSFITEKDTKIKHLEEQKERLLTERDKLKQDKDNILLESKQMLEMRDKELNTSKHQLETLRNELQEMKKQLDEQNTRFTHQEKILQDHKQQQQQYDQEIKDLHSEVERLKNESSKHLADPTPTTPFNLPGTAFGERLSAQNLRKALKSLRMIRI